MKNFEKGKSTIIGSIKEGTPFKKVKDYVGKYKKGKFLVQGFLKTHSKKYNKDQYSLYCVLDGVTILLNVPYWYGSQLEDDFTDEDVTPEEYFEGASIKEISTFETKYHTESINITIYE